MSQNIVGKYIYILACIGLQLKFYYQQGLAKIANGWLGFMAYQPL